VSQWLVGEVGAAAAGIAATLDDLSSIYEAPAVCAKHLHTDGIVARDPVFRLALRAWVPPTAG
jgi:hypothetical protein